MKAKRGDRNEGGERRGAPPRGFEAAADWIETHAAGRGAVLLVALSRFDIVNAAYGRGIGDALLQAAEERIARVAHDLFETAAGVVRVEGSAFALMVTDGARIGAAASRLDETLARPFAAGESFAVLGARFGIAVRREGEGADALLARAHDALDLARASDGATISIADPGGATPLDTLAVDLHRAIERGEIELRYQPQVDLADDRITGVEALVRWDHPTLGPLGADTLFAAAERADLGVALSDHIQQAALACAVGWPVALGGLRLSLNLTAADVSRPGFAALFLARLDASGFPRERLTLEITETGLIGDLPTAAGVLGELRAGGCRIALDDFGTGYSSLAYLKALPLDTLKIDRALTVDIAGSPRDQVVVRGILGIARGLGLNVVAEGVETPEQRDLLAAEGCDLYQGFLRSPPLTEAALIAMVVEEEGVDDGRSAHPHPSGALRLPPSPDGRGKSGAAARDEGD